MNNYSPLQKRQNKLSPKKGSFSDAVILREHLKKGQTPTATPRIDSFLVSVFTVPTESPEADGTIAWNSTTMILVEVRGGGAVGFGYTYGHSATGEVCQKLCRDQVVGQSAFDISYTHGAMVKAVRNAGRPGICSTAISAVDCALWDLKSKILNLPLHRLLGQVRTSVAVYGSGGFTSYTDRQLQTQLDGWLEEGITQIKIKVGSHPEDDLRRVQVARAIIGDKVQLFVDANGAYSRKQALRMADGFADLGVSWFEEPVPSDDLVGLNLIRDRAPSIMQITAGEYGYDALYFRRMLESQAVDVLMADATRCGGLTGFMQAAHLCEAFEIPLSSHCAPAQHIAVGCATSRTIHLEYFYDHSRIEKLFFEGCPVVKGGKLAPSAGLGFGLELKRADANKFAV